MIIKIENEIPQSKVSFNYFQSFPNDRGYLSFLVIKEYDTILIG